MEINSENISRFMEVQLLLLAFLNQIVQLKEMGMLEITLEDLSKMGRRGGATARLYDGSIYSLTPHGAKSILKRQCAFAGEDKILAHEKSFSDIYPVIRTVKIKNTVVARRDKKGLLVYSGRGYKVISPIKKTI